MAMHVAPLDAANLIANFDADSFAAPGTAPAWMDSVDNSSATAGKVSPIGAAVTIKAGGKYRTQRIVTGDSFYCQQPAAVHWGLGKTDRVEAIEVVWPDGKTVRIDRPAIDRYRAVRR